MKDEDLIQEVQSVVKRDLPRIVKYLQITIPKVDMDLKQRKFCKNFTICRVLVYPKKANKQHVMSFSFQNLKEIWVDSESPDKYQQVEKDFGTKLKGKKLIRHIIRTTLIHEALHIAGMRHSTQGYKLGFTSDFLNDTYTLKIMNKIFGKNKGWKEAADHTGKAPRHKAVATKKKLSTTLRVPMYKPNEITLKELNILEKTKNVYFHGTPTKTADAIISNGLKGQKPGRGRLAEEEKYKDDDSEQDAPANKERIYLSNSYGDVMGHEHTDVSSKFVIFAINGDDLEKLNLDTYLDYQWGGIYVTSKGTAEEVVIPPEYLTIIRAEGI